MGSTSPSFLNMCLHQSLSKSLLTTLNAIFGVCLGRSVLELAISTKDSKRLGGPDPVKAFQDCLENIQKIASPHHIFTTRSTTKI